MTITSDHPAPRVLSAIMAEPWAILPGTLELILEIAARRGDPEAIAVRRGTALEGSRAVTMRGTVAVIPVIRMTRRATSCRRSIWRRCSMATGRQTMLVAVGPDTDCPTSLLEFPKQDVDPGEAVTIRAWAPAPELLTGLRLDAGLTSLGTGSPNVWPGQTTCKYFDFGGEGEAQRFDYPVTGVSRVIAFSPLYGISESGGITTLAPAGEDVTALFHRRGYACLAPAAGLPKLYGTVHAVAERAPYCREWAWTAPADPRGAQWFFLWEDGELTHRFSLTLSEDPEDTSVCYTDIKIRVIDRRTAGAVLGANVVLGGVNVGQTDQRYGFVKVFRHLSGTFPIVVTKAGYPASNADSYADNNAITIPPAGGEVRVKIGSYA